MKIIAIRIKNLASLEGTTEINFTTEPLCSAGIFAITGATGAGKSTILDALCLALYGKTPRYIQAKEIGIEVHDVQGSTIGQGDVRGILRDGMADGFGEVDFVGVDGQKYRATWQVRRARNKADGSMQADSVVLKNIDTNTDFPAKKAETYKEIERLVGLNFEQFTRSVLLAQGDFTAFLKANKDEKSSLLEKLTGTHIYSEISKKIYEKYKQEEQLLRELNIRKEGIMTLTEDELKDLHEEQAASKSQIKNLEKEIEGLVKEISWHQQLAALQTNQVLAVTTLQHAGEARTLAAARRQKFHQVAMVQQTRSWEDALKHARNQQSEKAIAITDLEQHIAILIEQKETLNKQLEISEADLTSKTTALTNALPLIEEAKRLDTLLAEKKEQLQQAKDSTEKATAKSNQLQQTLTDKRSSLSTLLEEIKILENWKTDNINRQPIAVNKDIILSKLQDAQRLLQTSQSCAKELAQLEENRKTTEAKKLTLEMSLASRKQEWKTLKATFDEESKSLRKIPIETHNRDKADTDSAVQAIIQAQAHWQLLYNALLDFDFLNAKQVKDQSDYQLKKNTLEQVAGKLATESTRKETSTRLLQSARMAASQNVEALRASLVDNDPCPVCGSIDHPYTQHNPQLNNVLAELEKAHANHESSYLTTFRKHNALEQECETLKQTINRQSEEIGSKKIALELKQQQWSRFDIATASTHIADAQKYLWIEEKLELLKTKQADLNAQTQSYHAKKQQLETAKGKLDELKENVDSITNHLKDNKGTLDLYMHQQTGLLKEQETASFALREVEAMLNPHFTASDWMENWKTAPEPFLARINAFAKRWKENAEKLDENNQKKATLEATLKELESQAESLSAEVAHKATYYSEQDTVYQQLRHQRNALFEGKAILTIEAQLKQAIEKALHHLDQEKSLHQQLNLDSLKAVTQKEQFAKEIATLENDTTITYQKIQEWIDAYNQKQTPSLTYTDLIELLAIGGEWIDSERTALQAIEDEFTKASSILSERSQLLEAHQQKALSDRPLEELTTLITAARSAEDRSKQANTEINFRLQQHEANKKQIGTLLKSIATQTSICENWSKLNDIIGSADGKKFRQIAQEYTLDVLLGYANIHLQSLTNRYKIQRIPNQLGLQVVDQDMGDEIRTVFSLSGGESFLISLALALGLASLSSSKMKVESLFIDEGFGSLDPATLNIAMDALERLHNQGRKVGVISHVQEMTERIPTQIKVSKMASGKSNVEVIGI